MPKTKKKISAIEERCSGCQRCALACSFFTSPEKAFNLSKSKITVVPSWDLGHFEISFSEDCTHCAKCVQYCEFGALKRHEQVSAASRSNDHGPTD